MAVGRTTHLQPDQRAWGNSAKRLWIALSAPIIQGVSEKRYSEFRTSTAMLTLLAAILMLPATCHGPRVCFISKTFSSRGLRKRSERILDVLQHAFRSSLSSAAGIRPQKLYQSPIETSLQFGVFELPSLSIARWEPHYLASQKSFESRRWTSIKRSYWTVLSSRRCQ
jgi:hypothetical protein